MLGDLTRRHRTGLRILLVALAVVAVAVIAWQVLGQGSGGGSDDVERDGPAGMATRTVQSGEVKVRLTPEVLNGSGARFKISFDTHTVTLSLDPARSASLRVNDRTVTGATWDGDGPGGHHREGMLLFSTAIPSGSNVELRLAGLPQGVTATWRTP